MRIGAVYALYCLFQTQRHVPRTHIYVPLLLLDALAGMVPELVAEGALDAVKMIRVRALRRSSNGSAPRTLST